MRTVIFLCCILLSVATEPKSEIIEDVQEKDNFTLPEPENVFFYDTFSGDLKDSQWVKSGDDKFKDGDWKLGHGTEPSSIESEQGLIVVNPAKHSAISAKFTKPFDPKDQDLVIQYEVRFHKNHECGGAYLKILKDDPKFEPKSFKDDTEYIVMFGPDKCGTTDKVHFIFRHQSPKTQEFEEKHLTTPPTIRNDRKTHLYTLVIRKDNTYEIFIDQVSKRSGKLLADFDPSVNPAKVIDDPEDKKPADWVDDAKMQDSNQSKPDDWDEEAPAQLPDDKAVKPIGWSDDGLEKIPDPEAEIPEDWSEEDDGVFEPPEIDNPVCKSIGCGEWKRPMIPNPDFKGKWIHPMIDNPEYKGEWKPKQITNPNYFEDENPHALHAMGGIGIEIWTMQEGIEFDNVFVDSSYEAAYKFGQETWAVKHERESAEAISTSSLGDSGIIGWVTENPIAAAVTLVVSVLSIVFIIYKFCLSDSDEADEDDVADVTAQEETDQQEKDSDSDENTPLVK